MSNLAGGTVKEPYAEIIFQRFDLQRYRGLGEENIFGGLAKIQVLGHDPKHLQRKFSNCAIR